MGALAGLALGWLFDESIKASRNETYNNREYDDNRYAHQADTYEGQRNSFLFSLLVLASYIIRADGKIMHSEMELLRRFLRQNFGEAAVSQGEEVMLRLFEQQKQMGAARVQSLIMIAKADGVVVNEEVMALRNVAAILGIAADDLESMLNMSAGSNNLEAAYKVLGITSAASNDEVKAAYRKMALKHHPDRVATLGEDVRKAAEKKFQEINEAKETIFKARGM